MEYEEEKKTFSYSWEESKRTAAEKLDGSYLLKTDRADLSAEEAWRIYTLLTRAEAAFRTLLVAVGGTADFPSQRVSRGSCACWRITG
ncbi:MAG: hypothetical protein DMG57_37590 [Acidobacteria bacterium]|nr:MAG: hypothetical protein DMG57_37590 [Acidobacteriota bacterium]